MHKNPAFPILGKDGLYFLQVYRSKIQYIKLFLIVKKSAVQTDSTFQSVEKDRFKVFVHFFSKSGGYLGQSPKPTSAEVGTPQYKAMYYCLRNSTKFCRGVGRFFLEKSALQVKNFRRKILEKCTGCKTCAFLCIYSFFSSTFSPFCFLS